jgi:Mn2+/Fe2+ NRAMP family transporter
MIVSAFFGAGAALRQVSLHIIPPDPGYGGTFLGYHYYTWAFIVFAAIILGTAIIAAYSTQYHKQRFIGFRAQNALGKTAIVAAVFIVAANVVSTFVECGPGQCPDNPVSYWLFN